MLALSSRLEQWFACKRLLAFEALVASGAGAGAASDDGGSGGGGGGGAGPTEPAACHAHFDGHLCWPATEIGQTARVACPRLQPAYELLLTTAAAAAAAATAGATGGPAELQEQSAGGGGGAAGAINQADGRQPAGK